MNVDEAFRVAGSWFFSGIPIGIFLGFCVNFVFYVRKWFKQSIDVSFS